jgi:hypothetical protein
VNPSDILSELNSSGRSGGGQRPGITLTGKPSPTRITRFIFWVDYRPDHSVPIFATVERELGSGLFSVEFV